MHQPANPKRQVGKLKSQVARFVLQVGKLVLNFGKSGLKSGRFALQIDIPDINFGSCNLQVSNMMFQYFETPTIKGIPDFLTNDHEINHTFY